MIQITFNQNAFIIASPFNQTLIPKLRQLINSSWDPKSKTWKCSANAPNHKAILSLNTIDTVTFTNEPEYQKSLSPTNTDPNYIYITKPFKHQDQMLKFAFDKPSVAFFCEVGTGKTKPVLDIINNKDYRALIVCPKTVIGSWIDEIHKHTPHLEYTIITGNKDKRLANLKKNSRIYLINYEGLRILTSKSDKHRAWDRQICPELQSLTIQALVLDESHKIKNYHAEQTKAAVSLSFAMKLKHRIIMTGTPIKSPEDIFTQFLFLDHGETFGKYLTAFKNRYFQNTSTDPRFPIWSFKPGAEKEIGELMAPKSFRIKKQDCLDLPPRIYQKRQITMTPEQTKAYTEMANDLRTEIEGQSLSVTCQLAAYQKLTQITSGFSYIHSIPVSFKQNPKLDELKTIITEDIDIFTHKIIIWCLYKHDIHTILDHFKHYFPASISGETPTNKRADEIRRFQQDPTCRLFVGQAETAGIGITLTEADFAIFYSQGWSPITREQCEARNHRAGSEKHKSITYIDLLCDKSIDETIHYTIIHRQQITQNMLNFKNIISGNMTQEHHNV